MLHGANGSTGDKISKRALIGNQIEGRGVYTAVISHQAPNESKEQKRVKNRS